jgi:hypothetical protein
MVGNLVIDIRPFRPGRLLHRKAIATGLVGANKKPGGGRIGADRLGGVGLGDFDQGVR